VYRIRSVWKWVCGSVALFFRYKFERNVYIVYFCNRGFGSVGLFFIHNCDSYKLQICYTLLFSRYRVGLSNAGGGERGGGWIRVGGE
jgi:hypothetical protein